MLTCCQVEASDVTDSITHFYGFFQLCTPYLTLTNCPPISLFFNFLVAHRLSSIVHCDTIIVMEKGVVVETGTHQQLMLTEGVYANMWRAQNGDALESAEERKVKMSQTLRYAKEDSRADSIVPKKAKGGFVKEVPIPLSSQSLLWTATSESLASLVISGGGKGLSRGSMEPLMMMQSGAREDRLGFIEGIQERPDAAHSHKNGGETGIDVDMVSPSGDYDKSHETDLGSAQDSRSEGANTSI